MSITSRAATLQTRYHPKAYEFVFHALRYAQQRREQTEEDDSSETEEAHVSGPELLEGIRMLALARFGLLTNTVFHHWGISSTEDFGRIVFELIESGKMKKTDRDQLSDFYDVYEFEDAFDRDYCLDTRVAFRR